MTKRLTIALAGNPNSGKSSLFNHLTGLNQHTANFPGVTVEKHVGICKMPDGTTAQILDLPGIYSLYPRSLDERIVSEILLNHRSPECPDVVVVIADATNLKRGLLLLTQVMDVGLPTILAMNMMDLAARSGVSYDIQQLKAKLGVPVVPINARTGSGLEDLKRALLEPIKPAPHPVFELYADVRPAVIEIRERLGVDNDYEAYQLLEQPHGVHFLSREDRQVVEEVRKHHQIFQGKFHGAETIARYTFIQNLLEHVTLKPAAESWKQYSYRIDNVLTHKYWGMLIFLAVLFLIFQSIFSWASIPMDLIDGWFATLSNGLEHQLPDGPATRLLTEGVIPGIGGIVIFVPQIAILFAFISMLEESGYMARVVFMMDKIMRQFGLNGRSVVPLMSGVACAIPAILSTRMIENWKERIITILVTPLMSCSARIPVFTILIALIVPQQTLFGFFNLQGLMLMGLYLLGFLAALISAWVISKLINVQERSFLLMEMPTYRVPKWSNVGYTIVDKTKAFVWEAGKIIIAISIVLWVLASYGPGDNLEKAHDYVLQEATGQNLEEQELDDRIAAYKLEHSYAGIIGKAMEPAIKPLGYDWKIGIALLTSFAAREVFVGTMATIYSIGSTEDQSSIKSRMQAEINPDTDGPRFTFAVGMSLLIFYTFAMQCMSTLAVVYRETKSWKWPFIQLAYMSVLAYASALVAYQVLA